MKKILSIALLCIAAYAHAATTISTATVSGHWTLVGSPYMINNNITVSAGQALTIDPGVQVLFNGRYMMQVNGILKAAGTGALPITFKRADTTGFSTNMISSTGGWHGIFIAEYTGTTPDSSILKHCNLLYTKFDTADVGVSGMLVVRRPLLVQSCNLSYSKNNPGSGLATIMVFTNVGELVQFDSCIIGNNTTTGMNMYVSGYAGGTTSIRNSSLFCNTSGAGTVYSGMTDLVFKNNNVYQNDLSQASAGIGVLTIIGLHAWVKGNSFHDNVNQEDAAINCTGGFVDIDGNMIYNNHHISGFCGVADGGGAINVGWNSSVPADSTAYIIRNNVIANNYSPFHGGAINIIRASTTISNNTIVNNKSVAGAAIYIRSLTATNVLKIKNNLFYGNTQDTGTALTSPDVTGEWLGTISYENNWSQHTATFNLAPVVPWGLNLFGDTTTNIVGTNPHMAGPTLTANYTESAATAVFALLPTSACIDHGDSTAAMAGPSDVDGNARIFGTRIDIGAYEFNPAIYSLYTPVNPSPESGLKIYPNPVQKFLSIISDEKIIDVTMTNALGQMVYFAHENSHMVSIDVSGLSAGMYLLNVNGKEIRKVTKQ